MAENLERLSTGVIDLDDKIEGGLIKRSTTLITGKTGTGKTAFCSSFLYAGAQKGERGLYITTEESEEDIKNDIKAMFNWDIDALVKRGLIKFLYVRAIFPIFPKRVIEDTESFIKLYVTDLLEKISSEIKNNKIQRVVIDSSSMIEIFIKDEHMRRVALARLIEQLKTLNVTTLIAGTVPEDSNVLSYGGIIEFLVDGVIKVDFVPISEEYKRTLTIRKMRRTDHSILIHPFEISKKGLRIVEVK